MAKRHDLWAYYTIYKYVLLLYHILYSWCLYSLNICSVHALCSQQRLFLHIRQSAYWNHYIHPKVAHMKCCRKCVADIALVPPSSKQRELDQEVIQCSSHQGQLVWCPRLLMRNRLRPSQPQSVSQADFENFCRFGSTASNEPAHSLAKLNAALITERDGLKHQRAWNRYVNYMPITQS